MIKNSLTLCLFTSTLGHFGRHDIYRTTISEILSQVPAEYWSGLLAHIKVRDNEEELARAPGMVEWLRAQGFEVSSTLGNWSHFAESHQLEYLKDVALLANRVTTPYILFSEDDWVCHCYTLTYEYWLHEAVSMLERDPELMQVRFARFTNERDRIHGLRAKHGIDGRAEVVSEKVLRHNDFANHPSIMRTRDLRAALRLVSMSNLPKHSEHGTGRALKLLSSSPLPFASFNPEMVRVGHIGTRTPEEAEVNWDAPLLAD